MSENGKVNSQVTQDAFRALISILTGRLTWMECPIGLKDEIIRLAHAHFLAGALYGRTREERLQSAWAQQRLEAMLSMESLESFERQMRELGICVIRIKGASLVPRYYDDPGFRHLCDVDVLVDGVNLQTVEDELLAAGYKYQPVVQWKAASYRRAWMRRHETGMPLSLDLHTRLLWDQERELNISSLEDPRGFRRLTDDVELLHLIVNWVEQDTCVSFNKMYDIYTVISAATNFSWARWMENPAVARHWRAIVIVRALLKEFFDFDWAVEVPRQAPLLKSVLKRHVRQGFFADPRANLFQYFLFKHLTKSFRSAVIYDILWGLAHAGHSARLLVMGNMRRLNYGE